MSLYQKHFQISALVCSLLFVNNANASNPCEPDNKDPSTKHSFSQTIYDAGTEAASLATLFVKSLFCEIKYQREIDVPVRDPETGKYTVIADPESGAWLLNPNGKGPMLETKKKVREFTIHPMIPAQDLSDVLQRADKYFYQTSAENITIDLVYSAASYPTHYATFAIPCLSYVGGGYLDPVLQIAAYALTINSAKKLCTPAYTLLRENKQQALSILLNKKLLKVLGSVAVLCYISDRIPKVEGLVAQNINGITWTCTEDEICSLTTPTIQITGAFNNTLTRVGLVVPKAAGAINSTAGICMQGGSCTAEFNDLINSWELAGDQSGIVQELATLKFNPNPEYSGNPSLTTVVQDGVNPKLQGVKTIRVTPVNDAPVITTNTLPVNNNPSQITSAMLTATDVEGDAITWNLQNIANGHFATGSPTGPTVASVTQAQIDANQVWWVPDHNNIAASGQVVATDGVDPSAVTPIGFQFTANTAPTITGFGFDVQANGKVLLTPQMLSSQDIDGDALFYFVANKLNGLLEFVNSPGNSINFLTPENINAGEVNFASTSNLIPLLELIVGDGIVNSTVRQAVINFFANPQEPISQDLIWGLVSMGGSGLAILATIIAYKRNQHKKELTQLISPCAAALLVSLNLLGQGNFSDGGLGQGFSEAVNEDILPALQPEINLVGLTKDETLAHPDYPYLVQAFRTNVHFHENRWANVWLLRHFFGSRTIVPADIRGDNAGPIVADAVAFRRKRASTIIAVVFPSSNVSGGSQTKGCGAGSISL